MGICRGSGVRDVTSDGYLEPNAFKMTFHGDTGSLLSAQ